MSFKISKEQDLYKRSRIGDKEQGIYTGGRNRAQGAGYAHQEQASCARSRIMKGEQGRYKRSKICT